jgi:CDP-glycerol glycerophosphotransferase
MEPDKADPATQAASASKLRQLEDRVAVLEEQLRRMADQAVALSRAVLERAKRDDVRLAVLEANRIVHSLARASQFYPKTRTVVFVGRTYFGDNVKYAYLAFCALAREKNIRCLFLPHDVVQHEQLAAAGLPSLSPQVASWSREDAQILLGASVVVLCDNFHPHSTNSPVHFGLLQGAKSIQLWHGIPLKEIGLQHVFAPGGHNIFLSDVLGSTGFFDVLVGPSAASESEWRNWFAFRDFAPLGNPRNDIFFREPTPHDLLSVDRENFRAVQDARRAKREVIIYGPTFRDHIGPDWFEKSGIISVAAQCRAQGHEFLINLHPFEQGAVEELRIRYPALTFIDANTDVYPIVKYASVFVTDYSSLVFDVLHVDCPLVFYRPDHAEYISRARALVPGREGYTPGEVVADPAGLTRAIAAAMDAARHPEKDTFRKARHDLRKKLFDHHDGRAGQRLGDVVSRLIEAMEREQAAAGRKMS